MNNTPLQTPCKGSGKKLPMIVDIAIGEDGEQVYQVHESKLMVRKEMPKFSLPHSEARTPIRNFLGTVSPSSLDHKRLKDEDTDHDIEQYLDSHAFASTDETKVLESVELEVQHDDKALGNDIWSDDVEAAFEEILAIIPKRGSNKIKISGRSCGRNELISDYISNKTGKYRSRKQVSSHIQVIKNLGQKPHIIKLINEGPTFSTPEEEEENNKSFEEIFTNISLKKSLGMDLRKRKNSTLNSVAGQAVKKASVCQGVRVENFFMLINDNVGSNPIILTYQTTNSIKSLELKGDAKFTTRFPGLENFQNSSIPIYHNMVKLQLPTLLSHYSIDGLQTNYFLRDDTEALTSYSVFTCIYSFGLEVLKFNEVVKSNQSQLFVPKFWLHFFTKILARDSFLERKIALKGITVKQIVYKSNGLTNQVLKLDISSVLLWEFAIVNNFKDTVTATTRLTLPKNLTSVPMPPLPPPPPAAVAASEEWEMSDSPTITRAPQGDIQKKFISLRKKQAFYQLQLQSHPINVMPQVIHPSVNANLMEASKENNDCQFGGSLFSDLETDFMNIM